MRLIGCALVVTSSTIKRRSTSKSIAHEGMRPLYSARRRERMTWPCGPPATAECDAEDSFAERNRCAGEMGCRYYIKPLCCPYVRRLPAIIAGSGRKAARPHRALPACRHLGVAGFWSCTSRLCPQSLT